MSARPTERLPITAIVASHNEASLLPACLTGLSFCDELIVIDIDSTDDTAAVAKAHGARVVRHPWVPIAEQARGEVIAEARNDWLLVRDPDEVIPPALAAEAVELFPRLDPDVAVVTAPIQRYFGVRALKGGVWGGLKRDRLLVRRGSVEFQTGVNSKLVTKPGYRELVIPPRGDNVIAHYWVSGYRSFLEKHLRYLRLEGRDRADAGEITGWRAVAATPWRSFRESFVRERGYRDGLRGVALGLLWSLYRTAAEVMLLRELRRRG